MSNLSVFSSGTGNSSSIRVIRYEDLLKDGIVLEDINRANDSVFHIEYYQASQRVHAILERNQALQKSTNRHVGCRCPSEEPGTEVLFNVIPFIGPRGSGKTSAMRSFQRMLTGYTNNCAEYDNLAFAKQQVSFLGLQYIDVSTLKSTEDVLSIILARMLQMLMKEEESLRANQKHFHETEELRGLYQLFDRIYGNLLHLEADRDKSSGESNVKMLRDLSSSYSIARDFRHLMHRYLEFFKCSGRCRRDDCYLVIALDDVDLYCYKNYKTPRGTEDRDAYTLLERVYEYLMIPGVIVLMTYNEDVLLSVGRNHIINKLGVSIGLSKKLLRQFLEKIIPGFQKVYMPDFQRADNPGLNQLTVELPDTKEASADEKYVAIRGVFQYEGNKRVEVKRFLLNYIASVYNTYFDAMGQKPHFFDKKNLRELRDFFKIISAGVNNNAEQDRMLPVSSIDKWHYMRMTSYLNNQFAHDQLDIDELELFERWSKLPIFRRSISVLDYIRKTLINANSNMHSSDHFSPTMVDNLLNVLSEDDHGYEYSYGELLFKIYQSTRTQNGLSKEMIYCLLATYSFTLTHYFENFLRYCKDKKANAVSQIDYQMIKGVLGSSVAGKRSNDILHTEFEYGESVVNNFTNERIKRYSQAGSVHFTSLDKSFEKLSLSLFPLDDPHWGEKLRYIEMICMFFTDVHGGFPDDRTGFRFVINRDGILKTIATEACFNILNFAANSFMWREFFDSLHRDLSEAILNFSPRLKKAEIYKKIKEASLIGKYESNQKSVSEKKARSICPLPIYQFDMMYNIIKREADKSFPNVLPHRAPVAQYGFLCWKVFENFRQALAEQDEFYNMVPHRPKLADIYSACPFIVEMKKVYGDGTDAEYHMLNQYMINLGTVVAEISWSRTIQNETIRAIGS